RAATSVPPLRQCPDGRHHAAWPLPWPESWGMAHGPRSAVALQNSPSDRTPKQLKHVRPFQRLMQHIALDPGKTQGLGVRQLLLCLDAFRHRLHAQRFGQPQDRAYDLPALSLFSQALDKGTVHLNDIERQLMQVTQGGIACPEV